MRFEFLAYVAIVLASVICAIWGKWDIAQFLLLLGIFLAVVDFKEAR